MAALAAWKFAPAPRSVGVYSTVYVDGVRAEGFTEGHSPTFVLVVRNDGLQRAQAKVTLTLDNGEQEVGFPAGPVALLIPPGERREARIKGAFTLTTEMIGRLKDGVGRLELRGTVEHEGSIEHFCQKYSRFSDTSPIFVPCGTDERREVTIAVGGAVEFDRAGAVTVAKTSPDPRRTTRETLGRLIQEAEALRADCRSDRYNQETARRINEWIEGATEILGSLLDGSYRVRFNNHTGMTFFGDASEHSRASVRLQGHVRRLHEFLAELTP